MHEQTPTNPAPTAVPWTPDMMTTPAPVITPTPGAIPAPVQHAAPAQPAYPTAHPVAPQPAPKQPVVHQPVQTYAPQAQPTPAQTAPMPQAAQYAQQAARPQHQHPPIVQHQQSPIAQQIARPQAAPMQAPNLQQPQMQTPQAHYTQAPSAHGQYAPAAALQHLPQAGIPPLVAPHLQTAAEAVKAPSKSLFAKLLKRSPKPALAAATEVQAPQPSGSLFNKNFALGAVAGLVVGAFVLPMLLNMFGAGTPAQTKVQAQAAAPITVTDGSIEATASAGDTFIDQAISIEAP